MLSEGQELAAELLARGMAYSRFGNSWEKLDEKSREKLMDDARFNIRVITPILADTPRVEIQVEECTEPQQIDTDASKAIEAQLQRFVAIAENEDNRNEFKQGWLEGMQDALDAARGLRAQAFAMRGGES